MGCPESASSGTYAGGRQSTYTDIDALIEQRPRTLTEGMGFGHRQG